MALYTHLECYPGLPLVHAIIYAEPHMGIDDEFPSLKDAVREHGAEWVRSQYERRRERALDVGDEDEADLWEARRESVGIYVARRRFRYNLFSFSAGAVLALLPTGYVWLEGQDVGFTTLIFVILTVVLYLAIRFIDRLVSWVAGVFILSAIGVLGWEVYIWLREAQWPGLSVGDAFAWIGITPSFVSIEGWVGVSKIINAIYIWLFEHSLPAGCLYMSVIFGLIAVFTEYFDVPKMEEEEI